MKYGAVMRACREKAGMSQEKLAELLHRSRSCISKLEGNQKTWDMETVVRWAEVTNAREVVVAFLYGMDGLSMVQNLLHLVGA